MNRQLTIHKVNDASDAVADALAMIWAAFYAAQAVPQDQFTNAITGCFNQAIVRLGDAQALLGSAADQERARHD